MTTPFVSFTFAATGGTASRSEPARWADFHNVLDFGADPTGVGDSTTAIQAAIDWTANDQRGTIYFPLGSYRVTGVIDLYFGTGTSQSIILRGEGNGTHIVGTVNGYIFDRHDPTWETQSGIVVIEKLFIENGHTGAATGAIRLGNTNGAVVRDCHLSGTNGIVLNQNELFGSGTDPLEEAQYLSENTLVSNCTISINQTARTAGTNGVVTGNGTTIINMDCSNFDCAIRMCGKGNNVVSGRFEENNYGHIYGVDQLGNAVPAQGCAAGGFSMESNRVTQVDYINASACVMSEVGASGQNGSPDYGFRLRSGVSNIVLLSCAVSRNNTDAYNVATIAIEDSSGTPGSGNAFIGCAATSTGGTPWLMPTKAKTAKFINSNNPVPSFTFANLPSGSDVVFGDEYIISNSNVAVSAANFAATVTGSGLITAKVRWNGANWIIA